MDAGMAVPAGTGSEVPSMPTDQILAEAEQAEQAEGPADLGCLRRELLDFSRALRSQLKSYEERQERLIARLQAPPQRRRLVISLDDDDYPEPDHEEHKHVASAVGSAVQERSSAVTAVSHKASAVGTHSSEKEKEMSHGMWKLNQHGSLRSMEDEKSQLRTEHLQQKLGGGSWGLMMSRWVRWWLDLQEWLAGQEPPKKGRWLSRCVGRRSFEALCTVVIAVNSVMIVYNTNYEAQHLEEQSSEGLRILGIGFVAFYVSELCLRLAAHGPAFFCNEDAAWNSFDAVLVVLAVLDLAYSEVAVSGQIAVTHLRVVRVLRVLRSTKVLRVLRLMRFFSQLRLLLSSVLGSLASLFWGAVLLAFLFFIFALIFVQGATMVRLQVDPGLSDAEHATLRDNLGSTQAGMLLLLQSITGGEDWGWIYRQIALTGPWNCALFLFYITFAQLALLNILTGLFVESALKLAEPDRDTAALLQRKRELAEAEELRRLCAGMDDRGLISEERFLLQLGSEQFKAKMALLGLDMKHAELFFSSIASGRGEVDVEAFVAGAMRLKGHASALDLQTLALGTRLFHEQQIRCLRSLESRLESLSKER